MYKLITQASSGRWEKAEEKELVSIITEITEAHCSRDSQIPWAEVSRRMGYRCGTQQCSFKWFVTATTLSKISNLYITRKELKRHARNGDRQPKWCQQDVQVLTDRYLCAEFGGIMLILISLIVRIYAMMVSADSNFDWKGLSVSFDTLWNVCQSASEGQRIGTYGSPRQDS
jgi:hypothetical protein